MSLKLKLNQIQTLTIESVERSNLLNYAKLSRNAGYFNDVTIKVENDTFPCNRLVLACYSKFFEETFKSEKEEQKETIEIKRVDKNTTKLLIEFIYSGSIAIKGENVLRLIDGSERLKIEEAKQLCFKYLESAITMDDCVTVLKIATIYKNETLLAKVFRFLAENFTQVAKQGEFYEIAAQSLKNCITSLNRDYVEESLIYMSIISWVTRDEKTRRDEFPELFQLVQLDKLSSEFLEDVVSTENLILENTKCSREVMYVITRRLKATRMQKVFAKRLAKPSDSNSPPKMPMQSVKPTNKRLPNNKSRFKNPSDQFKKRIMCLGKWRKENKITELFNVAGVDLTTKYPYLPVSMTAYSAVLLNHYLYCIGGIYSDLNETTKQVWKLNLDEAQLGWKKVVSMNDKRNSLESTIHNGLIVVAGGRTDGDVCLSSSEYYDPSGRWIMLPNMNEPRYGHCLVTCSGHIYAAGGAKNSHESLRSVECLRNIPGTCWENIQPMNNPRSWFSATVYNGAIYVVGGASNPIYDSDIDDVEKYTPGRDSWISRRKMSLPLSNHSACVFQNKIYVVEGLKRQKTLLYDPAKDSWAVDEKKPFINMPVAIYLLFNHS